MVNSFVQTSYQLRLSAFWFSRVDLFAGDAPYTELNPLLVMQSVQVDLNGDGLDDLFTYDSYPLDVPTPNPPPSVFLNRQGVLDKVEWTGPVLGNPHGVKILVGDFDGDSLPDLFSLVAIDPPNGAFPDLLDYNNLLFNSAAGFDRVKEFDDQRGFWYAGTSGDIDGDGDLDIVMFNFHFAANGVTSKIMWNDGHGDFTYDSSGIGTIPLVDQSELVDIDGDGMLDLVIDHIETNPARQPIVSVLWGNGADFQWSRAAHFNLQGNQFLIDMAFADLDGDGTQEIILASVDDAGHYGLQLFQSDDEGANFVDRTASYFTHSLALSRFDHILLQDVDGNGRLDLYAPDRADNIRWEWNGSMFARFNGRGELNISGEAMQGETLSGTNTITDAEGTGPVTYHWQFSDDAVQWSDGGSGPQHQLTEADAGKYLRLVGSYTDGAGTLESMMTGVVGPIGVSLQGGPGPDRLTGRAGNDFIDGGPGVDLAVFSGPRSAYEFAGQGGAGDRVVTDGLLPRDGIDTLSNIERLQFADVNVALDLDGNAGTVAKILSAVFGPAEVYNEAYAGIGLYYIDGGMTYESLMQLAIDARLGGGASHQAVVDLLYTNVVGIPPGDADRAYFVGLLDSAAYTVAGLGVMAADIDFNVANINLVGLAQQGLEYVPFDGA